MIISSVRIVAAVALVWSFPVDAEQQRDFRFTFETFLIPDKGPDQFVVKKDGVWLSGTAIPNRLANLTAPVPIAKWEYVVSPEMFIGMARGDVPIGCAINRTKKGRTQICFADPDQSGFFTQWFFLGDPTVFTATNYKLSLRRPKPLPPVRYQFTSFEKVGDETPGTRFEIRHMEGRLEVCRFDGLCTHSGPRIEKAGAGEVNFLGGKFSYVVQNDESIQVTVKDPILPQTFLVR